MFWRFGGYANISTIDTLLEKPDFTLENLLDEADLLHEIKQHNAKLVEYLREEPVLEKLLDYVIAPCLEPVESTDKPPAATDTAADDDDDNNNKGKGTAAYPYSRSRASSLATSETDEDEDEKRRNRYAYVASEVLASDTWSIYEALMENGALVRNFWNFLSRPAPLDPLQASYFTKVNEALFEKKTEDMIEVLKSVPNAISDLLRHVECPMIMDLLLKIIALDRTEGGQGIVEWLYSQDVVPILLSCLSPDRNWVVQTAAGDFIKAIITISANASQNEQQCIGPNELTRQLVSTDCVKSLIKYMLAGGNPLTVGVGIVIEVIRKNNSDYDPDVGAEEGSMPSCRDPIYLGTLLRLFAEHVPDFMKLIMNAPTPKQDIHSTFGHKIEPLGFDRFKTCELMAELLHCSNMGLMNEVGSEELIVARDAERHRLRDDGKLVPRREDDMSMSPEDLSMRFSHHEPHGGDGRRLEVTNVAEDDGFEEVEHSREMNEDTSHEFVKAEDEIPLPVPIPSFFDRDDDDDLMDEPLSSPRLHIKELELDNRPFDEPDLVVAPLSPKKRDATAATAVVPDAASSAPTTSEEPRAEERDVKAEKTVETAATDPGKHAEDAAVSVPTAEVNVQGEGSDSSAVHSLATAELKSEEIKPESSASPLSESSAPQPEPKASETGQVKEEREDSEVAQQSSADVEPPAAVVHSVELGQPPVEAKQETPAPEPTTGETTAPESAKLETSTIKSDTSEVAEPEMTTAETPAAKAVTAETPVTVDTASAEAAPAETPKSETPTTETAMPTPEAAKPPPAAPAPPAPSQASEAPTLPPRHDARDSDDGDPTPGTESIIIRAVPDPPTNEAGGNAPERPVVGDYLKMQFVEHRVVPAILTFFFKYPWNNFLHNVVYDIVQQVFNGPMDRGFNPTLAVSLFESADVTNAIIQGQRVSDESQAKSKTRMGYMGHLTLIAEEVVKFTERHPPELLSDTVLERVMCQDWVNYVEGALAETRERDNAILGGVRPEVAMSNRAAMSGIAGSGLSGLGPSLGMGNQGSASSALADAGLNGNLELDEGGSGSGLGPFAISAGTMMSGFGSSSDEEDDEVEDTEEDINNEFRSYTDPLNNNNNGSSLNPPSIPPPPPPPPPLNTPPSRARLQLAARLAMHQKTSAAAIAAPLGGDNMDHIRSVDLPSGAGIGSSGGDDDDDDEPLRDPFGDDADEVDSDDADSVGDGWGEPSRSGAGRGGWWRDVVMKRDSNTNMTDSDDEGDEEFGDFAMPEGPAGAVATGSAGPGSEPDPVAHGARPEGLRVVKPLALHPGGTGAQQKSGFGSLWPFGTQSYGQAKEEGEGVGEGSKEEGNGAKGVEGSGAGDGISRTVEAKTRTSLDDGDDEVVI